MTTKTILKNIGITAILLLLTLAMAAYKYFTPLKIYYPNFGISIPRNYSIHGIDVSRHQGAINWPLVKAMHIKDIQIEFAFIKATEGSGYTDLRYLYNWKKSKDVGIMRGAYHYYKPQKNAKSQALHFIHIVKLQHGDLPPVLDFEEDGGFKDEVLLDHLKTWLKIVEAHYGMKPIIYVNTNFYHRYIKGNLDEYPIWIAHYYKGRPRLSDQAQWKFWQHHDGGRVDGISEKVDFNVFRGKKDDLLLLVKK